MGDKVVSGIRKLLNEEQLNDLVEVDVFVDNVVACSPDRSDNLKTEKIVGRLKSSDWIVSSRLWSDFKYYTMPGKLLGDYKYEVRDMVVNTEAPLLGERLVWMEKVMSILIEWWYGKKEDKSIPNN